MGKSFTVADVLDLPDQAQVVEIRGTLTKLYDRKAGKTTKGKPWSIQNGVLEDDTGEIKVMFNGRDLVPSSFKGREIIMVCTESSHGLNGIKAIDDDYNGEISRILKVTEAADVDLIEGGGSRQRQEEPPRRSQPRQQEPPEERKSRRYQDDQQPPDDRRQTSQQAPPKKTIEPGSDFAINEAKKIIVQSGNLMLLTALYFENVFVPKFKELTGKDMDEQRKGAWTTSIRIQAENKGAMNLMPTKPLFSEKQSAPQRQQEPPPPQEPPPGEPAEDDIPF